MRIAVLCIGDELLKGATLNSNLAFLGEKLLGIGLIPVRSLEVPDQPEAIRSALDHLMALETEIILISGGLGATEDDRTKETIAAFFGRKMTESESLKSGLSGYWDKIHPDLPMPPRWMRQAWIPERAEIIPNHFGTAAGLRIDRGSVTVFMMPGPPSEQKPMFENQILPMIQSLRSERVYTGLLHVVGVGESLVEQRFMPVIEPPLSVAYCASPGQVKLFLTAPDRTFLAKKEQQAREIFRDELLSGGCQTLAEEIVFLLKRRNLHLATAESCTGGMIAAGITDIPGASAVFDGGIVVYSNEWKQKTLQVSEKTLREKGAVSAECASEMVHGLIRTTGADCGISVTGIAGPDGGSAEKPVGLVYIGIRVGKDTAVTEHHFRGSRAQIRERTVAEALNSLRKMLRKEPAR